MDKKLLEALAARAEQRAQARTEVKPFEIGGQMIECKKLSSTQQLEYYGALAEAGGAADMIETCTSLIYDSCPALQDTELHKTLGITDPYDAVRCLMSVREIDTLGGQLMQWNGLLPDKADGQSAEDTAKKRVARDPFLDLAAFYAPRGIPPDELRRMSVLDRAVLRVGRARYYEEMRLLGAAGVAMAFSEQKEGG